MMMHCLGLGGLDLYYDEGNEERLRKSLKDNPNPYYYELTNLLPGEWPVDELKGKCVKAMGTCALNQGIGAMRVVYMQRNTLAQYKSSKKSLGNIDNRYDFWRSQAIRELSRSKEVEDLVILDYDEVLNEPLKAFTKLANHDWPIDPVEASLGVDRSMKHY
jgi:hypothetical protein